MERAGTLINRLLEQYQQNASGKTLATTAQLLLAELQQGVNDTSASTSKVSVMMPLSMKNTMPLPQTEANEKTENGIQIVTTLQKEATVPLKINQPDTAARDAGMMEIPTLMYQKKYTPELNETIISTAESLNDKLKLNKTEVGSALHESPVRDLRKAIGINDRYLFINELFRGDEASYERSIKTINAFNILAEAEYWIKRELKLKLGWAEETDTVKLFDQLVKRRFS